MTSTIDTPADTHERYRLSGSPTLGLAMGTWGFFVGFAAVALYGPAAKYFQEQMNLGGLALGLLVAAPQLTGSLLRIPFGAWVDRVGGRLPMLTLFALSLVGMWGLVFILLTVKTLTVAAYPIVIMFGFLSGCGVASFSVGIPQVSYWYPQSRQGTALGVFGGIGNLAPGVFTLLLPYAIGSWGLAGSYFSWFTFLLVAEVYLSGIADYGIRIGIAGVIMLISLVGGRIVPSFTHNWLARRDEGRMPAPFSRFDVATIAVSFISLALWVALPDNIITGGALIVAAIMQAVRLARWAGDRTIADRLVLVLHVGYAFVSIGFALVGVSALYQLAVPASVGIHAWTAGAIGLMTLAVMSRASLGHTAILERRRRHASHLSARALERAIADACRV